MNKAILVAILASALSAACSTPTYYFAPDPNAGDAGDDASEGDASEGDAETDPLDTDTTADTSPEDTSADLGEDTLNDAGDAAEDASDDGGQSDVLNDTAPDITTDTAPDTPQDTTPDTPQDTTPDTTPDVRDSGPDTTPDVRDSGPDIVADTGTGSCTSVSVARGRLGPVDFTLCDSIVTYVFADGYFLQENTRGGSALMVYENTSWTNPQGIQVGDVVRMRVTLMFDYNGTAEITGHDPEVIVSRGQSVSHLVRDISSGTLPDESFESQLVRITGATVSEYSERSLRISYGSASEVGLRTAGPLPLCVGARFSIIAPVTEWYPSFEHRVQSYAETDIYDVDTSFCDSGFRAATLSDLVINEVLADPGPVDGDANCDGERHGEDDEFIELLNISGETIDIGGVSLADVTATRITFPPGTVMPPNRALVVFGGGNLISFACDFGGADVYIAPSKLGLNNTSDTITLRTADGLTSTFSYDIGELDQDQSVTRSPEGTGAFVLHTTVNPARPFSPGVRASGSPF